MKNVNECISMGLACVCVFVCEAVRKVDGTHFGRRENRKKEILKGSFVFIPSVLLLIMCLRRHYNVIPQGLILR